MNRPTSSDHSLVPQLTVAICTRNPRTDYLARVLHALSQQTLPLPDWELVLIDSASDRPLTADPARAAGLGCRLIRLEISGLVRARFAAIAAAAAPVLLFLDDDNVPAPDFLATGLELGRQWPALGCWASACILPECETPPPRSVVENLGRMACCDFPSDRWSNTLDVVPPGAGLFVRTAIALHYASFAENDPRRQLLGETGDRFFRGDDTDLVFFIVKQDYGAGQFRALKLTHLMPTRRLTEENVVKLAKASAGSAVVVNYIWGVAPRQESRLDWLIYQLKALRFRGLSRRVARAHREGEGEARELIRSLNLEPRT